MAAGTGGLLTAHEYVKRHNTLTREGWQQLNHAALHGWEIVDSAARLCVMNLYLHGIGHELRTNMNFTLKQNPLSRGALDGFAEACHPANCHERTATWSPQTPEGRWRAYGIDELLSRDKVNLDIFWLRDESLEDGANLPEPDVIAAEIVEDLRAALAQFEELLGESAGEGVRGERVRRDMRKL